MSHLERLPLEQDGDERKRKARKQALKTVFPTGIIRANATYKQMTSRSIKKALSGSVLNIEGEGLIVTTTQQLDNHCTKLWPDRIVGRKHDSQTEEKKLPLTQQR
jgi:hypothetical protein